MGVETITIAGTGGVAPIELELPGGSAGVTPASRVCLEGIGRSAGLLGGTGIDWGSGSGCLAIAAARLPGVVRVVGIEVFPEAVAVANRNAERNGVAGRVEIVEADLYAAADPHGAAVIAALEGATDFLIANPPASDGDDGLGWRRALLSASRRFLVPAAPVLVQVSYQYGERIRLLGSDVPGFTYERVVASTDWVPFDQSREDLAANLRDYAAEEERGGLPYRFNSTADDAGEVLTAVAALARVRRSGTSPFSKWQFHLFRWEG